MNNKINSGNDRKYFEGLPDWSYKGAFLTDSGLRIARPEFMEDKYLKQIDNEINNLIKEGYFTDSYEFWENNVDKDNLEENFKICSD